MRLKTDEECIVERHFNAHNLENIGFKCGVGIDGLCRSLQQSCRYFDCWFNCCGAVAEILSDEELVSKEA